MSVQEISQKDFDQEVLQAKQPVLVDFNAQWCGPCRMLAPVLAKVSEQFTGKIKFTSINTDDNPDIASQYNITGIPCLIVFKSGQEIKRIVGFHPEAALAAQLKSLI